MSLRFPFFANLLFFKKNYFLGNFQVKSYYRDCSDFDRREELGNRPALELLKTVTDKLSPEVQWYELQAMLVQAGLSGSGGHILDASIGTDWKQVLRFHSKKYINE